MLCKSKVVRWIQLPRTEAVSALEHRSQANGNEVVLNTSRGTSHPIVVGIRCNFAPHARTAPKPKATNTHVIEAAECIPDPHSIGFLLHLSRLNHRHRRNDMRDWLLNMWTHIVSRYVVANGFLKVLHLGIRVGHDRSRLYNLHLARLIGHVRSGRHDDSIFGLRPGGYWTISSIHLERHWSWSLW